VTQLTTAGGREFQVEGTVQLKEVQHKPPSQIQLLGSIVEWC